MINQWFCACLALLLSTTLHAQSWDELSPDQQSTLSSFSDFWNTLPKDKRKKLSNAAKR